jgi:hypothetical protein
MFISTVYSKQAAGWLCTHTVSRYGWEEEEEKKKMMMMIHASENSPD